MTDEIVSDPEPVAKENTVKCGEGTQLVDGFCKVIVDDNAVHDTTNSKPENEPVKEQKGFFEWLMSLFGT